MAPPAFDLQSHSTMSDGELSPAQVVARAREAGVDLLALTDHDTVAGVQEALDAAAASEGAIRVVPAVEISALDESSRDLHICGYLIDHRDPVLLGALASWRADRHTRARGMAAALREVGWRLERMPSRPGEPGHADAPIGRPHLARAVFEDPANAERLAAEGLGDAGSVLEAYLVPGAPCYRARSTPCVAEAIEAIHGAGGVAVWAHPFWDIDDPAAVAATLDRLVALGLDGVEAFYASHSREQTLIAYEAARARNLLTTGSADFHGPGHRLFNAFRAFDLHGLEPDLGPIAIGARPA
ncbi:MAG: PHP domain-containing protein [Solirubrobacteraceae bacterium]|nr:PHP domain-containing protein [Solirubrobacteraceae bacterium]